MGPSTTVTTLAGYSPRHQPNVAIVHGEWNEPDERTSMQLNDCKREASVGSA